MARALDEPASRSRPAGRSGPFFERSAATLVNRGGERVAGEPIPEPLGGTVHRHLAARWKEELAVDEVVAAVREGDASQALALAEGPELRALLDRDRAALAGLLELLMASEDEVLFDQVRRRLRDDPHWSG